MPTRLAIVTGMSGAGKSTALRVLEDAGYFCVDNLPIPLIEKLVTLAFSGGSGKMDRVALGWISAAARPCRSFRKCWSGWE